MSSPNHANYIYPNFINMHSFAAISAAEHEHQSRKCRPDKEFPGIDY